MFDIGLMYSLITIQIRLFTAHFVDNLFHVGSYTFTHQNQICNDIIKFWIYSLLVAGCDHYENF